MFAPRELLEQVGGFDESFTVAGGGYAEPRAVRAARLARRTSRSRPSSARARSTRCTAVRRPISRTRPNGGRVSMVTASTTPTFGAAASGVPGNRSTMSAGLRCRRLGGRSRDGSRPRCSRKALTSRTRTVGPSSRRPYPTNWCGSSPTRCGGACRGRRPPGSGGASRRRPPTCSRYQEIIAGVRPDWIVETGTGDGGRALFLASMCELVGHGEVISIDLELREDRPHHPRLRYLAGRASDEQTSRQVRETVGDGRALVVLGSCVDRREDDGGVRCVCRGSSRSVRTS